MENNFGSELYKKFKENSFLRGYFYLPEHFRDQPPPFHLEVNQAAHKYRHLAIAAPRESAKSTILAFLYAFHAIMFQRKRFIVIIGNTEGKAKEHLDAMKRELKDNDKLKTMMPKVELVKDNEVDTIFRHADGMEIRVLCKGVEQIPKIRGAKFVAYRPDLIIGDDMEDDELVESKERRQKLKVHFDTALMPAGDRKLCQYIMIGTILHDDCQLAHLLSPEEYTEFHKMFYEALDEEKMTSLWPQKWTVEDLEKIKQENPLKYAKEYQNNPIAGKNVRFKKEDFRYWMESNDKYTLLNSEGKVLRVGALSDCRPAMSADLAWETRRDADYTVLMGGLLTPDSEILVYNYVAERGMRPDKFCNLVFEMFNRLRHITGESPPLGLEKAMLEKVTKWNLKQEMKARNEYITVKQLSWETDKIKRIETILEPRFSNHVIFFKQNMGDLEYQLTRFPHGTYDDLPDALNGMCQLLKYPKNRKKAIREDDGFELLQKFTKEYKNPPKKRYLFGKEKKRFEIPHIKTIR